MKKQEIPYHIFVGRFMGLASSYTDLLPHSREADAFRTRICNRLVEIAAECSAVIEAHKTSPAVGSGHEPPSFDEWGNRVNPDGSLWNLDGKLAARNGND